MGESEIQHADKFEVAVTAGISFLRFSHRSAVTMFANVPLPKKVRAVLALPEGGNTGKVSKELSQLDRLVPCMNNDVPVASW